MIEGILIQYPKLEHILFEYSEKILCDIENRWEFLNKPTKQVGMQMGGAIMTIDEDRLSPNVKLQFWVDSTKSFVELLSQYVEHKSTDTPIDEKIVTSVLTGIVQASKRNKNYDIEQELENLLLKIHLSNNEIVEKYCKQLNEAVTLDHPSSGLLKVLSVISGSNFHTITPLQDKFINFVELVNLGIVKNNPDIIEKIHLYSNENYKMILVQNNISREIISEYGVQNPLLFDGSQDKVSTKLIIKYLLQILRNITQEDSTFCIRLEKYLPFLIHSLNFGDDEDKENTLFLLGSMASIKPDTVKSAIPWIVSCAESENPLIGGTAFWAASRFNGPEIMASLQKVKPNFFKINLMINGNSKEYTVTDLITIMEENTHEKNI